MLPDMVFSVTRDGHVWYKDALQFAIVCIVMLVCLKYQGLITIVHFGALPGRTLSEGFILSVTTDLEVFVSQNSVGYKTDLPVTEDTNLLH